MAPHGAFTDLASMPPTPSDTLPLRLIIEQPLAGVALALQAGKDGLEPPTASSTAAVVFDFAVRLGPPRPGGAPGFLGPYTQGPPAERFVYVCVGRRAGQAGSAFDGRIKVPLTGITGAQVKALLAAPGKRLAVRIPGRTPKGGPTLATVKLPEGAWQLVADGAR